MILKQKIFCSFGGDGSTVSKETAIMMAKLINKNYDFLFVQSSRNEASDAKEQNDFFASINDDILKEVCGEYNLKPEDITGRYIIVGAAERIGNNKFIQANYSNGGSVVYSSLADNNYNIEYGTSCAAPQVVGIAAMTWMANP